MGVLNEELHRDIVDKNCTCNREKVTQELSPAADMGGAEGDVSVEPKARKEGYREDDNKREDMWRDNNKSQIYKLLCNNKVVD